MNVPVFHLPVFRDAQPGRFRPRSADSSPPPRFWSPGSALRRQWLPPRKNPGPGRAMPGIAPGIFAPGPYNAITDVEGVLVGHATVREGDRVRTGVTAIRPPRRQRLPPTGCRPQCMSATASASCSA